MGDDQKEFMETLDAHCEVFKHPLQIVEKAVDYRWTFAINHVPGEQHSDAEPPNKIGHRTDFIPICELLGRYDPNIREITIFKKGIDFAAQTLDCNAEHLRLVVRIHEWFHGLLHVGFSKHERFKVTQDESLWPGRLAEANAWFRWLDPELHERLVQLLTYHSLQSLQAGAASPKAQAKVQTASAAFEALARRQPAQYRIDRYASVERPKLFSSIALLKERALVGASAWDTVITW